MTLGCHQPYLFPYIGYFQLINSVDKFVLLDDVNAGNIPWVRSNEILDGKFALPVEKYSQNKPIKELYFKASGFLKFAKRLKHLYGSAPYYGEVVKLIDCFSRLQCYEDRVNVADYNAKTIKRICEYIGITTEIRRASDYPRSLHNGQHRILFDFCKAFHADTYINAEGGKELYDAELFARDGVELKFLTCTNVNKKSILDILMHHSPQQVAALLNDCEIKP